MHRNRIAHTGDIGIFEHVTGHRGKREGQTGQRGNLLRERNAAAEHFPVGEVGQVRVVRNRRGMQVAGRLDLAKHAKRLCGIVGEVAAAVHYVQQVVIPIGDAACEPAERRGAGIVAARISLPRFPRAQSKAAETCPEMAGASSVVPAYRGAITCTPASSRRRR